MATITGLTAERMLEIEAASVVDGDVVGNDLILARQDGSIINAGNVRGPAGPTGPMGSALAVVTARDLLDVGQPNQIRAGRQLTPADFTNMGLSAPLGLWNLSNANDSSGNARHLTIKGAVPFDTGINGLASTAAKFSGSTAQALYIADTGAADPFRIKTGSWGCWFRTARRGTTQTLLSKWRTAQSVFTVYVFSPNTIGVGVSADGTNLSGSAQGTSDVCDDRWHLLVATHDGTRLRAYIDGAPEINTPAPGVLFSGSAPLNIGGENADGATATTNPHYGRVDEAFITNDVLTEDQIRNLYCASVPHALGSVPNVIRLNVRRKRRGAALATTDFPSQPLRLHNFTAGALTDQGSNAVALVSNPGTGAIVPVGGADGSSGGAYSFSGANTGLSATDAGLPAGTTSRSYGAWFKTTTTTVQGILSYGNGVGSGAGVWLGISGSAPAGTLLDQSVAAGSDTQSGFVADGLWHHGVMVVDNAAVDGLKRKMYLDGRLVASSTTLASTVLGGANRFRIGASADGAAPFVGQLDGAFVHNVALTPEQVRAIYDKGSQVLAPSPKSDADHIEAIEAGRLLATFDSLETCDAIDLAVMA